MLLKKLAMALLILGTVLALAEVHATLDSIYFRSAQHLCRSANPVHAVALCYYICITGLLNLLLGCR